jgi:transcriptional regulator with XRE-family HTH domain
VCFAQLTMPSKQSLGKALRLARRMAAVSQDDMTVVSSRAFVSAIERGVKSPTIEKLSSIATALNVDAAAVVVVASLLEARSPDLKMAEICESAARILAARE